MRVVIMFTWISLVLLSSNLFTINGMPALSQCLPDQKSVLLQIKTQLSYNSSLSFKLVQWDERVDCCQQWPGVGCNEAGDIIVLDLSYEPVRGGANVLSLLQKLPSLIVIRLDLINFSVPFPRFFADFANLEVLSLMNCNFSGTVPEKVFQVPTLQVIDLSFNQMLEGCLPDFQENGSLQSLTLHGTKFYGNLPQSIGNLRLLSHIDLSGCDFRGAIPSFKLFKNLSDLDLSDNNFTGEVPSSHWDGLDNLVYLKLDGNLFSGHIPESVFFLQSLVSLGLSGNKFAGHINALRNVTSPLEFLDLSGNNLEGPIPSFFFRLENLTLLHLSSNKFSGQIVDLQNVSSQLTDLDLSRNNLEGTIPSFFFQLQNLSHLSLSSNKFHGTVHLTKFRNQQFDYLDLSHNNLVVETSIRDSELPLLPQFGFLYLASCNVQKFPNFLKNQTALNALDLSGNNLSSIPLDIGDQLPYVILFSIANNRISGRVPLSLCRAAVLQVLNLSNNTFQGTIPSCLVQNNSILSVINLKGNRLSGEIPQVFRESCSLETLDLSQNQLQGKIPPSLVKCTKLKVLNLGSNRISDTFPCWLKKLSNLHILVLCSNHFHGSISCPRELGVNGSWPSLKVIDLASNSFSGTIPADLFLELIAIVADRNEAQYLHLTFSGTLYLYYDFSISLSVKGNSDFVLEKILSIFTSIDFSSNQFEGRIPETIGELKQLYLLNISHNALTAKIPPSLGNLKALEALDISFNNLAGNIPEQLQSLNFLSLLNLSYNDLVGRIPQGNQFNTFCADSFIGNKGLHGFQLNVSCTDIKKSAFPVPKLEEEEEESAYHGDIYASVALGFAVGLAGLFWSLLLSEKWRLYYNQKIDGILLKIFFHRGQGRRKNYR